jgi:hypothetical protein
MQQVANSCFIISFSFQQAAEGIGNREAAMFGRISA